MKNLKIQKFTLKYFFPIKKIYKKSFPKNERFPFWILLLNILKKKSKMYILLNNKKVNAFIYTIYYKQMIFILYLAVEEHSRNNGYGSYLLNWFLKNNVNKEIYVNIDEIDDKYQDNEIRKARMNFYLNNNFYLTNYLSVEKSGNYNILTTKKNWNIAEYKKLDQNIAFHFFNKKSNIVNIKGVK